VLKFELSQESGTNKEIKGSPLNISVFEGSGKSRGPGWFRLHITGSFLFLTVPSLGE
jgi:hypothetical protein